VLMSIIVVPEPMHILTQSTSYVYLARGVALAVR